MQKPVESETTAWKAGTDQNRDGFGAGVVALQERELWDPSIGPTRLGGLAKPGRQRFPRAVESRR